MSIAKRYNQENLKLQNLFSTRLPIFIQIQTIHLDCRLDMRKNSNFDLSKINTKQRLKKKKLPKYSYSIFLSIALLLSTPAKAQIDAIGLPSELEYQIESYIENIGEEVDFDYNTIYETLNTYLKRPLNLNRADDYELESLNLLNAAQINSLAAYKAKNGELLSIYELQAVPNFDLATIYRIKSFVTVNRSLDDLNETFASLLAKSKKNLFVRWSRNVEVPQGFRLRADAEAPAFEGDLNRYYLRYAQTYENRISFGITLEKDPGESFFAKSNKQGFDFMSGHFMYKKVNKVIHKIVIGDMRAQFGQGLILNTGFAPGKSVFANDIRRSGATLNRFTSVNEQNYLRGLGMTFNLGKNVQWSTFISSRKRDGNAISVDTLDREDLVIQNLTSLQLSGLHRTEREIESENTLDHLAVGSRLKYKSTKGSIAFNVLYNKFSQDIGKSDRPYNLFAFNGNQLLNASLDYTYLYKNLVFFGETAWSDNNQIASVNGLIVPINTKVAFSIHQRYMPKDFHSLFGQTFSETTGTTNENGIYLGLTIQPTREWRFAAYADTWKHPWLRFRADAPSGGSEYYARLTYYKRRDMEAYIHWKYERKQQSYRLDYTKLDELLYNKKSNFRFQLNKKLTKRLELRSRLEWSIFDIEKSINPEGLISYNGEFRPQDEVKSTGFVAYQDIIYKPVNIPFSLTTRFALFDVSTFDARIYAFENEVTYQFSIPAYYNKGSRFYAILKYRAKRHLTLEARYAQTYWANQEEFGSGNNRIDGQTRSEVKVQARWRF